MAVVSVVKATSCVICGKAGSFPAGAAEALFAGADASPCRFLLNSPPMSCPTGEPANGTEPPRRSGRERAEADQHEQELDQIPGVETGVPDERDARPHDPGS